jgi:prepilin-type processing-associated H-X9-DG protein
MLVGHGAWDTHEPNLWPGNTMDKFYRGALHGTGSPFNNAPATPQTGTVTQMLGAERFANIVDGTTNTLMVGELTFGRNDVPRRATFWAYTYASYNQSSITAESRHLTNSYNKCAAAPGLYGDQLCKRAFGSFHPQGLNFVLCDGSVRWVSYNADINLLQNMATIEGGESQSLP